ncbi:unnamed protein product [Closterium sp. NIES-54]
MPHAETTTHEAAGATRSRSDAAATASGLLQNLHAELHSYRHCSHRCQVSVSGQVATPCSCRLLSHQTLLWHHRLGHPFLPRLRGMHSRLLVSGFHRSLPPLPPSPAPPYLPCVEGRQRAAPQSSSFPPTTAPLQTLHMDVWGPAHVIRLELHERFCQDLPVLRLHSDRGGEFSSDLLWDFCRGEGILQVVVDSGAARGAVSRVAASGGSEHASAELGGAKSEGAESGDAEPRGTASAGGPAGASPRLSHQREPLAPQQLREWISQRTRIRSGAARAGGPTAGGSGGGGAGATSPRGAGVSAGAGGTGGSGAPSHGGARTRAGGAGAPSPGGAGFTAGAGGTAGARPAGPGGARTQCSGAAGAGSVGGTGAGDPRAAGTSAGGAGAGGAGAGGAGARGAGDGGPSAGGAGAGDPGAGGIGARDPGAGGVVAGDPGDGGAGDGGAGAGGTSAGGTVQR